MSFQFLGTFTKSQFERFIAFARGQLPSVEERISHLQAERGRVGTLTFTFDESANPTAVTADPSDSYLAKLLAAYEVLGGDPFLDLRTRTKDQALFVVQGDQFTGPQFMSNGEPLPQKGLQDAFSAALMRSIQTPLEETLRYRKEALERKIRRMLDYCEQLEEEMDSLQLLQAAATVEGSLEQVAAQIGQLFSDTSYRAIYDDQGTDPWGKHVYAPFSAYDVEPGGDPAVGSPDRTVQGPQRQGSGYIAPGGENT